MGIKTAGNNGGRFGLTNYCRAFKLITRPQFVSVVDLKFEMAAALGLIDCAGLLAVGARKGRYWLDSRRQRLRCTYGNTPGNHLAFEVGYCATIMTLVLRLKNGGESLLISAGVIPYGNVDSDFMPLSAIAHICCPTLYKLAIRFTHTNNLL